jgi:uncharacterized protein (TIGR02246 family)
MTLIRRSILVAVLPIVMVSAGFTFQSGAGGAASPTAPAATTVDQMTASVLALGDAFTKAFERGDAAALGAMWAEDADYVAIDGRVLRGRAAIEADYADLFKEHKGLTLRIEVHSLRFPSPDVALEDGVTSVMGPEGTLPSRSRYANTLVRQDGRWQLLAVREMPYTPPNHSEHLRSLDWVSGEWIQEGPESATRAHAMFRWSADDNFILAQRGVIVGGVLLETGSERIGWDPVAKRIRSWNFESDGGFGEGTWQRVDDAWVVRSSSTLSSGGTMTMTATIRRVDADTIAWQGTNQRVDGNAIPDSPVVTMKRVR